MLENLREDFPDLVSASAGVEGTIPDTWLPAIREALTSLRKIRDGTFYFDMPAIDLHVRGIRVVSRRFPARLTLGIEVHAPSARGRVQHAILGILRRAQYECAEADKRALGRERADDIERDVRRYVEQCLLGRRVVDYRPVIFSGVHDSAWTKAAYVDLVAARVRAFAEGADIAGLDASARSGFLDLRKSRVRDD